MKQFVRRFLFAAAPLAAVFASSAFARPPVPVTHPAPGQRVKFDPHKFWRVNDLRPGMKGYALTVFKGTKIERFGIEVLGVVSKFNEGQDYILFRATSGPPVTRGLNIAHGMSGSPIYIDGKLAGAVSMGLPFAKDPIGLATPIENMLDAWSPDLPSKPSTIGAVIDSGHTMAAGAPSAAPLMTAGGQFLPLDVPLAISGVGQRGAARFASALAPFGFHVLATGGAGSGGDTNPLARGANLVPGAAVGVSLVQGDIDLTATGTVTYRDGNRILIFGHPFTDFGPIDAALTTAYVVDIFPSFQDSIKLGSPIKTVGRVFQDRPFSVGGVIGSQPQMVPVTVAIDDQSLHKKQTFRMRVINHPLLTGTLVPQLVDAAIAQVHGQPGDSVAVVTMDADVEEIGHVRRTNTFYDGVSIDQAATADIDALMGLLSSNSFYPLAIRSLKVGVSIASRHDTAQVDHIFLRQGRYAPGDTINVGVVLKPFKRDPVVRTVSVKIPLSTPSGTFSLSVRGGGSDAGGGGLSLGGGLIILTPSAPSSSTPAGNVAQLVKQFVDRPRNTDLVARLLLPTSAVTIGGEKLSGLPPTLLAAMGAARTSGLKLERDDVRVRQATPYIVSGSGTLSIVVQKKSVGEGATVSTDTPSAPPPDAGDSSGDGSSGDSGGDGSNNVSTLPGTPDAETMAAAPVTTKPSPAASDARSASPDARTNTVGAVGPPAPTSTTVVTASGGTHSPIKTVGRLAQVWRQGTTADFAAGTLKNVTVTSAGDVRLAAALTRVGETDESYLWSLLPDGKGGLLAGTGDRGMVYRMGADGHKTPFFDTKELEVTALARDTAGNVYAGTAPHGVVFVISPDGKGRKLMTAQEKYVTALCMDNSHNRLYVGTGGGTGRVYRLNLPTTDPIVSTPWFTSPEAHILSLAVGNDGTVYAGSAPDGIVYAITESGSARVLYDAPEPNIAALAVAEDGTVYAGTAPRSVVYKISPDGPARSILTGGSPGIASLTMDGDTLYACGGGTVSQVSPDEVVQSFVAPTDEQFLTLTQDNGQIYAGASVGTVYKIGSGAAGALTGTFQSVVHDAGLPARWGTIAWTALTPTGTHVALQTRTGDVERPDASWSSWTDPSEAGAGRPALSPPGRYFQYQATLTADAGGAMPRLQSVTTYYLPRNQPPTLRLVSPQEGDALSHTATVRWAASDPDKDTLSFVLSYSSDGGKTWIPIQKKTGTPTHISATASNSSVSDADVAAKVEQMRAGLDKHPEIPAAVRQQMLAQAPDLIRQAAARTQSAGSATGTVLSTSQAWDTTQVPDGSYQLKVVASDAPSNPQGALTAQTISATFLVDNTSPTLTTDVPVVSQDKSVTLTGTATTGPAFVKAVQARVDGGDLLAASASDGLFDEASERWTLTTASLSPGVHTLDIQMVDGAGNTASTKVTVTVP